MGWRFSPVLAIAALIGAAQPGAAQRAPEGRFTIVEGQVYGLIGETSGSILLNEQTGQTWLLARDAEGRAMWFPLQSTEEAVPALK